MELIKIGYITKPFSTPPDQVKRRRNYLEKTGYTFVGFGIEKDDIEDAKFEKRIPVGGVVRGMLELIAALEIPREWSGYVELQYAECLGCGYSWGKATGREENHADDCDIDAFKKAFTDD